MGPRIEGLEKGLQTRDEGCVLSDSSLRAAVDKRVRAWISDPGKGVVLCHAGS